MGTVELAFSTSPSSPSFKSFKATRNYTGPDEKNTWWYIARYSKEWKAYYDNSNPYEIRKEGFRTRRQDFFYFSAPKQTLRMRFENSNEIGAFIKLTNSYCLTCTDETSGNLLNTIKGDLPEIPVINTSLSGCRIIGRMCAGNKYGLLVPETIYNTEMQQIQEELPDSVRVRKIEERLSALGNVIACSDKIAIIHPDIDKESEEIIGDTLQVEVFRHTIANNPLVGSYCILSNDGGLICPGVSKSELESLSSFLEVPLMTGTVNSGSRSIASGSAVNEFKAYVGMKTTANEISVLESVLQVKKNVPCET